MQGSKYKLNAKPYTPTSKRAPAQAPAKNDTRGKAQGRQKSYSSNSPIKDASHVHRRELWFTADGPGIYRKHFDSENYPEWFNKISELYENYEMHDITIHWTTHYSTVTNGAIYTAYNSNPNEHVPTEPTEMLAQKGAKSSPIRQNGSCHIPRSAYIQQPSRRPCRGEGSWLFEFASVIEGPTDKCPIDFYIEYDVTFRTPQLNKKQTTAILSSTTIRMPEGNTSTGTACSGFKEVEMPNTQGGLQEKVYYELKKAGGELLSIVAGQWINTLASISGLVIAVITASTQRGLRRCMQRLESSQGVTEIANISESGTAVLTICPDGANPMSQAQFAVSIDNSNGKYPIEYQWRSGTASESGTVVQLNTFTKTGAITGDNAYASATLNYSAKEDEWIGIVCTTIKSSGVIDPSKWGMPISGLNLQVVATGKIY